MVVQTHRGTGRIRDDAGHVDRRGCENMGSEIQKTEWMIQGQICIQWGIFFKVGAVGVF